TGPKEMRAFLREYGWAPNDLHWQYLVGSPAEVRRVVTKGFGVWYRKVSDASEQDADSAGPKDEQPEVVNKLAQAAHVNYDIAHNDAMAVVDQQGRIRKIYDNADEVSWEELLQVVQSLVKPPTR
ncbi:MAG: SCO family protein, partial [Stellaceae bacterium]